MLGSPHPDAARGPHRPGHGAHGPAARDRARPSGARVPVRWAARCRQARRRARPRDGAQLRDGARRRLRRVRGLPAHRRRPPPGRPDVRPVGPRRSDCHRRRAHDAGAGALAAARGQGARHRRRGRGRDEPERRQLPAEDAGGTAGAQSPGAVHQRARSAAADDPVAHAAHAIPPAVGRGAAGAGAAAVHPRGARRRSRRRWRTGRRRGCARWPPRKTTAPRPRRWRRCGRRSSRPPPRRVFDFAAAQTSDKGGQGGQGRPRQAPRPDWRGFTATRWRSPRGRPSWRSCATPTARRRWPRSASIA